MAILDTIKIVSDETEYGYIIINASDFDPETMQRIDDGVPLPPVAKLDAALAELTDVAMITAMQARDARKSAAAIYAARLAALCTPA